MLTGRSVLLIIGGGIAAYKSLDLIRRLKERGATVRCIMTKAAQEFVTPLSAASLSQEKVFTDLFSLTDEADIGHIALSRSADLVVVAPATADLLAKAAAGLANDLASNALLATDKTVLMAPAMNPRMWMHPATQRNVALLKGDGVSFVGPNEGTMAERGEAGPGRMAEPLEIVAAIEQALASGSARAGSAPAAGLTGKHVLVTSGPTHEPIDPVRYIANRSSGKQGHAIARAAAAAGAAVTLVSGPVALPDPAGVRTIHVETADAMLDAVMGALPADAAIFAAAVADWRSARRTDTKIKKNGKGPPALALAENPDILASVAKLNDRRPSLVIGFAAETEKVVEHARSKLAKKGCDWILANDVSPQAGVMGGDHNTIHLVTAGDIEHWPTLGKGEVARRLVDRIAQSLAESGR